MIDLTALKRIADGLAALGPTPATDDLDKAKARLVLGEQFLALLTAATPDERHAIVQVLKEMLAGGKS